MRRLEFALGLAACLTAGCSRKPEPPLAPGPSASAPAPGPSASAPAPGPAAGRITPVLATDPVTDDPDDPAIWVNPQDPAQSRIIATNKAKKPTGAIVMFGLDGKTIQTIAGVDRPNNVDVTYGLPVGGRPVDIAVATERHGNRLRIFSIAAGGLTDITGDTQTFKAPMGIGLYKRPKDGALFAIVSRKSGPSGTYLWQYRLEDDGSGKVRAVKVREFGAFSGKGEIEAVAVDAENGFVFYADEDYGIRKYHADPDHPQAAQELTGFGTTGFHGNREGIAIYKTPGGGYIVCSDQIPGGSEYRIYRRDGDHAFVKAVRGDADSTDGLDAISTPLSPRFPKGLLVTMNSSAKNFLVFDWAALGLP